MNKSVLPFLRKGVVGDWRNYFTAQSWMKDLKRKFRGRLIIISLFLVIITSKQFASKTMDKRNNFQPRSLRGNRSSRVPSRMVVGKGKGGEMGNFSILGALIFRRISGRRLWHMFFFSLSFLFLNREIKQKFLYVTGVERFFLFVVLNGVKLYIVKPFGELIFDAVTKGLEQRGWK